MAAELKQTRFEGTSFRFTINLCDIGRNRGNILVDTFSDVIVKSVNFSLVCPIKKVRYISQSMYIITNSYFT